MAVGILAGYTIGAQLAPATRTELLNVELEGLPGKEAHLYTIELAPGFASPRHWHPGHYFAYVVEGSGFVEEEGRARIPLPAGAPYYVHSEAGKPAYWHVTGNASATLPLKMVVVLIADKGQPITHFDK